MDYFNETYIKQEPNSIEEEFITVIPPPPDVTHDLPPNTESFIKEPGNLVVVKNEPINDESFLNATTSRAPTISNEIPKASIAQSTLVLQNAPIVMAKSGMVPPPPRLLNLNNKSKNRKRHATPPKRLAVVSSNVGTQQKESLPSTSTLAEPKLLNAKFKNKTNNIRIIQRRNKIDPTKTATKSTFMEKITVIGSGKPIILLNSQLGKRSKLSGNTKSEKALTNKKPYYNLQNVETPKVSKTPPEITTNLTCVNKSPKTFSVKSLNAELKESNNSKTTNKKIINYTILKKKVERIRKSRLDLKSTAREHIAKHSSVAANNVVITPKSLLTNNFNNQQKPPDIAIKTDDQLVADQDPNRNTIIESTIQYPNFTSNNPKTCLDSLEYVHIKEECTESNILDSTLKKIALNTNKLPPVPATPLITSEPIGKILNTETPASSKTLSEIKVKCLCRLTEEVSTSDDPSLATSKEADLKNFFHKMFLETRSLNKQQQRTVKMSLLQAICESEEMVENGKCCCF